MPVEELRRPRRDRAERLRERRELRLGFDAGTSAILIAGLALYLYYLSYTGINERSYDWEEHYTYIDYVARHWALPSPAEGDVYYHPPLYYLLAAAWLSIVRATHLVEPRVGLQLLSVVLAWLFAVVGVLTIKRFVVRGLGLWLAAALVVFWPYSVINAVRVHNDSLASVLMAAAAYYTIKWYQEGGARNLYPAALLAGLALLTKSSGSVVVVTLSAVIAWQYWRGRPAPRRGKQVVAGAAILVASLGLAAGNSARSTTPPSCGRYFGTACDVSHVRVANHLHNYLTFDLPSFLREPYAGIRSAGRDLFWNQLLKSSLFGTRNVVDPEFASAFSRNLARGMGLLLLVMLALLVLRSFAATREQLRRNAVVLLASAISLSALLAFRIALPSIHHNDFRHVFHLLILFSVVYAQAVDHWWRQRRRLGIAASVTSGAFVVLSIVYFVTSQPR